MKLQETIGATSRIWQIFIADSSSTTGAGLTGLVFNSGSMTCYYHRDTDTTATAVTLQTMTVGTYTTRGFKEIDATNMPGWYQLCPETAWLASGAKSVAVHLKGATNMAPLPIEVQLTTFDLQTATQSVSVSQWNGTNVSAPSTAGIPEVNIKNIAKAAVSTSTAQLGVNVVNFGGSAGTFASGRPEVNTTHLAGTISPAVAGKVGIDLAQVASYAAGAFAPTGIVDSGTAQAATGTTLQLRSAAAFADSELIGATIVIRSATTGAGQRRLITANVGSTDTCTVDTWTTTPTGTIVYDVFGSPPGSTTSPAPADLRTILGTAVSTPATAGILDVNLKNIANATVSTSTAQLGVNVVNAGGTAWASGALTSGVFASGAITATAIASAAFSAAKFAADSGVVPIRSNTAQAGAATTITLDASASAVNNFYNNTIVLITGGTGVGQARFITAYVGSTKVATVATWVTNPDNTSTFAILPFDAVAGASAPTAAQVATAVWQDTTGTDFTAAGSIGKGLFTSGAAPGAASGLAIVGSNMGTVSSVTGAVGSVTGNVGGNVVGSVASVTAVVSANVTKINSVTVTGAGTTLSPWGP